MELYGSRLEEMRAEFGAYNELNAAADFARYMQGVTTDNMIELSYVERRRIHNLKYFTWMEQQEKEMEDLNQLWYDREIWPKIFNQTETWDHLINEFNKMTGLLDKM